MNILDLKRKSLGWTLRDPGDSSGGGDASASPGAVSAATAASSPSATSASEGGTSYGSFQSGYGNIGGWSSAGTGNESLSKNEDGSYSLDATADRLGLSADDRATLSAMNVTQGDLASLNAAHDLGYAADGTRSLMSKLGAIPGMSQDGFFSLESQVPGNVEGRLGLALSPVNAIGQIAMQANPAYGLFRGVADVTNNMQAGMSFGDAAYGAVGDRVAGIVGSRVNQAVGAAVGPGLGQYNQAASVANIFGAGMPSINPGGIVANAVFGKPSAPQATASNGGGLTSPDGTAVQGYSNGGWSSSSGGAAHKDLAPAMQVEDQTPEELSTFTPKKFKDISYADWRKEQ
jgi:hypothetical protein